MRDELVRRLVMVLVPLSPDKTSYTRNRTFESAHISGTHKRRHRHTNTCAHSWVRRTFHTHACAVCQVSDLEELGLAG